MNMNDFRNVKNNVTSWNSNDVLEMLGLERKRDTTDWIVPTVGVFAVGVLVGAGIGLLFAPKPGSQMREDLSKGVGQRFQGAKDMIAELPGQMGIGSGDQSQQSGMGTSNTVGLSPSTGVRSTPTRGSHV